MTSVQTKKEGKDQDRQTILKQMKVRTKLKMDKSWINQGSEDERDDVTSPVSPQLKALEGRKALWSPTPESEPDRNSGIFTAKEFITNSSSPPVQSINKRFSYSSTENNTTQSTTSKPSPPPSTTGGNRQATSYIIRGQPVNAVSQVKNPTFFNGYQKSQIQARTTSLPRVPTATGYKMSTEEYKKLAPYNIKSKSGDNSDDETTFTQQEQVKRTEQASSVLRNTTSKDRSYVISAAKRHSGVVTQDSGTPFLAKRVDIQDEEIGTTRKSQTLPKNLSSYLADDANRYENNWAETQTKQTSTQPSPARVTERSSSPMLTSYSMTSSSPVKPEAGKITVVREDSRNENKDASKPSTQKESTTTVHTRTERVSERSSSPRLTSYSMISNVDGRSSPVKPEAGKITVVREESRNESKDASKPPTEKESSTTTHTTRTERVEAKDQKDVPKSLLSYLYEDASRFENNWKVNQNAQPALQTSPARVEVKDKKNESLAKSLDLYLSEDASRFENTWKSMQALQPAFQTSPARVEVKDKKDESLSKSLDSYLFEDASRFENAWKSMQALQPAFQTSPASASDRSESPKLTSWNTETRSSTIKPEPGKITVLRPESDNLTPKPTENRTSTRTVTTTVDSGNIISDIPKLKSCSDNTETRSSTVQAGPGKITLLREEREPPKVTTQASSTTRTVETSHESNKDSPDIPTLTSSTFSRTLTENLPIMQAGPGKITIIREDSNKPFDLISWTDLENNYDNRLPKEKPATAPTPVPRITNKDSGKPANEAPLAVISPELDNKSIPSNSGNRNVKISIETLSEQPQTTEIHKTERSSSPSITSNSGNRNVKISIETLSEQPQTTVTHKTERSSSPSIPSNSSNRNVKISIETLSEQPKTTETPKAERSSSPRPSPRSRESTMTTKVTESRYRVPETLGDTMLESSPSRSSSRTTVTTTRTTDPVYTDYLEDRNTRSTRTVHNSRENGTTSTTVETRYDNSSYGDTSPYDPQSSSKGILFLKEYVNTSENMKSPTTAGSLPDFSGDSEISYSSSSNYMYSSAPRRSEEGPCTYCGREIKDCAKIMLDHLNIYCHEYCFKCGICNKPMGDLIDSLFIHRDVVHCESCYEKLF
ncbi:zinc finger protein 185 isoform X3 [Rana temporaria]|uniref:zinc finger protein 185 isoform X3 n=1 Tax=Rana temporaria TaxID=8407 RepID=UPI001AAD32D8|nr:zinc finger protein 185 isoform X3 [Rana temporaria]